LILSKAISISVCLWCLAAALPEPGTAQEPAKAPAEPAPESRERRVIQITPNDQSPSVRAIAPIGGGNVFFLNHRGQVGVAKFSPGLSQIGWEFYSEVKLNALPFLAVGPGYSIVAASPVELTQGFDTNEDVELDFFQALVRDWPSRGEGVVITAGPVADTHGRILYALSPHSLKAGEPIKARLMAWAPATGQSIPVTESELPIESFALRRDGLLAIRLSMPDYTDGFFLSLTELPPPVADSPGATPAPLPFTLPSLILPAELTKGDRPVSPAFFEEDGVRKLILTCPVSRHLVEIVPEKAGGLWQGSVLLRGISPKPLQTLVEIDPGQLLGGGDEGFLPLAGDASVYRIAAMTLAEDGIVLEFTQPVDRFEAVKPENYSVKAIALGGGETALEIEPVIDARGRTVVLKSKAVDPGHVLRVTCQNVPSESGGKLLHASVFSTVHAR
jgi:hypothetical protein